MISVIVPVYNVEAYLEKCIRSIMDNTYKDIEIICINDGSPDRSLFILQKLREEDGRIRIVDQENQGVQFSRNRGLSLAKGDFIAFIDSDDWIHPQYFETLLNGIEENRADVAICGTRIIEENDETSLTDFDSFRFQRLSDKELFSNFFARHMCWGRLYRRSVIANTRFVPELSLGEDTLFNLQVLSGIQDPVVYKTRRSLYCYRKREDSMLRKTTYRNYIDFPEWVWKHPCEEDGWSWILLMQAIKFSLSYRYEAALQKDEENLQRIGRILEDLSRRMLKDPHISLMDKIIHLIMKTSPQIYRLYRIVNDPTMLNWEKTVKARTVEYDS